MKLFILSKINDLKLRNKLILSFVVVVFIPLLIVGLFLTQELRRNALDNVLEQTTSDMGRIKTRISEAIVPAVFLANSSFIDTKLKDLVNKQYESTYEVVEAYGNYAAFENNQRFYNEIANIRLYVNNETMLNNWTFIPINGQVSKLTWFQSAIQGQGLMSWKYIEDETRNFRKGLSLVRSINFGQSNDGVLVIDVNTEYLNWILSQETLPTMIVNSQNQIVATNQSELLGSTLEESILSSMINNQEIGAFKDVIFEEPSHILVDVIQIENSLDDLSIVTYIPDSKVVADANRLMGLGVTVISLSVIVALFLIYSFSHLISKRISKVSKQMNKVATGNLAVFIEVEGKDEIGQLSDQFNRMTKSIHQLLEEIEQKNSEKRLLEQRQSEMKLKMLASQINPHFLFNTLETIRMKAHMNGEKDISQIVKQLGRLLRTSIELGGSMIPLQQEISMVTSYLEIQSYRFRERLEYELTIDSLTQNILIPPLIIQPLVENAVIHGLEMNMEGGKVTVETKYLGNCILVEVRDNGVGISEEKRQQILDSLSDTEEEGRIGLRNVDERIKITYKVEKGLMIESEEGKGTRIFFSIPINDPEGDNHV